MGPGPWALLLWYPAYRERRTVRYNRSRLSLSISIFRSLSLACTLADGCGSTQPMVTIIRSLPRASTTRDHSPAHHPRSRLFRERSERERAGAFCRSQLRRRRLGESQNAPGDSPGTLFTEQGYFANLRRPSVVDLAVLEPCGTLIIFSSVLLNGPGSDWKPPVNG